MDKTDLWTPLLEDKFHENRDLVFLGQSNLNLNLKSVAYSKSSGACMLSLELYPTLWDPTDCSPPGSSVQGILQARILERVAMPSSRGSFRPRD